MGLVKWQLTQPLKCELKAVCTTYRHGKLGLPVMYGGLACVVVCGGSRRADSPCSNFIAL